MSAETELRKWLSNPDKDYKTNLTFGIKSWQSIEFDLISKHDIITDEFCNNLSKLKNTLKKNRDDYYDTWIVINEFLSLKCPPGAISTSIKEKLIDCLIDESKKTRKKPNLNIFNGLYSTLTNSSMQTYFKSNSEKYAKFIGVIIKYLNCLLKVNAEIQQTIYIELTHKVMSVIAVFVRNTPFLGKFREGFTTEAIIPLSELLTLLNITETSTSEWYKILEELYFDDNQQKLLLAYLDEPTNKNEINKLFNVPNHTFLLIADVIFEIFKHDYDVLGKFYKFLFHHYFVTDNVVFSNAIDMLNTISLLINLMKKYDVQLNFEISGQKALSYIAEHLVKLFDEFSSSLLHELLILLSEALSYNPMILEQSMFKIMCKCMLSRKEERSMEQFEIFLCLILNAYRRLSRAEKFISQLMNSLTSSLETINISKSLKRKRSKSKTETSKVMKMDNNMEECDEEDSQKNESYIDILMKRLREKNLKNHSKLDTTYDWPNIAFAWPNIVGKTFSKFISGLFSKPSLVIWKTLIFTLTDYIKLLKNGRSDENTLFLIEMSSALLAQYFCGSRLAEQSNKTWDLIEANRQLTYNVLKKFGMAILNQEHNIRTMNIFLRLCYYAGNFDLLSWYYCPDSFNQTENSNSKININSLSDTIHSYLVPQEWVLIEQRITNFGKEECRTNITRLNLQKYKASLLFNKKNSTQSVNFLHSILCDLPQFTAILTEEATSPWFLSLLTRDDVIRICDLILASDDVEMLLKYSCKNVDFVEILILSTFKQLQQHLNTKKSILHKLNFDSVMEANEESLLEIVKKIQKHVSHENVVKKFSANDLDKCFKIFKILSSKHLRGLTKNLVGVLSIALYQDVKTIEHDELQDKARDLVKEILHFNGSPEILRYINITDLLSVFSEKELTIYELLFKNILNDSNPENTEMLEALITELKKSNQILPICIILLEQLTKDKKYKEYFLRLTEEILNKIKQFFKEEQSSEASKKEFVLQTLSGLTTILGVMAQQTKENSCDEELLKICQYYIQNSMNCNNPASIKLLNICLTNKELFGLSDDEIKKIVNDYWHEYLTLIETNSVNSNCSESLLKLIFHNKSIEELVDLFVEMESNKSGKQLLNYNMFAKMAKLSLSKAKGSIFIEAFKRFSFQTILSAKIEKDRTKFYDLLECQKLIASNIHLPVSIEFVDDILGFLIELNIKKFDITIESRSNFVTLHSHMCDLCYALIQHRHFSIVDRIPQFVLILKDLIQAICWYRSDRKKDENLDNSEVTMVAELAHKLENIVKSLAKHEKDVKRVAPYLLIYIAHLITSNERCTTLYSKIKMHIESICYDLISVCDHRVEGFILRNCNEASKPIYEQMVKEYNKYHKFKGKV